MSEKSDRIDSRPPETGSESKGKLNRKRSPWRRVGIVSLWVVGSLLLLVGILCCVATWMLTPERLTRLINKEMSKELAADVTMHNVRFTFWSSLPHLELEIDSMRIVSRTLQGVDAATRDSLPADAAFLMSTGHFSGGINVKDLLRNRINLTDVSIDSMNLNLVDVNDSISNYKIIPPSKSSGIPYFTANSIRLTNPQPVRYYNVPVRVDALVRLEESSLERKDDSDTYNLAIKGDVDADVDGMAYIDRFPFGLNGEVTLHFHPFGMHADSYNVTIGNATGLVSVNLDLENQVRVNSFNYDIKSFNLNDFLKPFSRQAYPRLRFLNADLGLEGNARLTEPYTITVTSLPSMVLVAKVPGGSIRYDDPEYGDYTLPDITVEGELTFNGKDMAKSVFRLPILRMRDKGTELTVRGVVNDLMGDPLVHAYIDGRANLQELMGMVGVGRKGSVNGDLATASAVSFRVSDIKDGKIENMRVGGKATVNNLAVTDVGAIKSLTARDVELDYGARARDITTQALTGTLFEVKASAGDIRLNAGGYRAHVGGLKASSDISDAGRVTLAALPGSLPLKVRLKASTMSMDNPGDTMQVRIADADINGSVNARLGSGTKPSARHFDLRVKGSSLRYRQHENRVSLNGVDLALNADRLATMVVTPAYMAPAEWSADNYTTTFVRSMPRVLKPDMPESVKDFMARWRALLRVRSRGGVVLSPAFPVRNRLSNIDVMANFDTISIRSLGIRSQSSGAVLSGSVGNLRQFLTSPTPAPLRVRLDAAIDTVQINQLAAAYERGLELTKGPGEVQRRLTATKVVADDSVAVVIPRNIFADINATVVRTQYMDLDFYNLMGRIGVADGRLDIDTLRINADFGHAWADLSYDTSDLQNLGVDMRLGIRDINVVRFFKNFHTLLLMMPQMSNLSGNISAEAKAHVRFFPTMYVNVPSLWADARVQGRDLQVRQSEFIRHITKMMLIPGDGPLKIDNMDIRASVHDNLLMLYPFDFHFNSYKLRMGGLNNFGGQLYYHIGVMDFPLHFPFGINIKGTFRHPQLRFGGAHWKDVKGTEIAAGIMDSNRINIVREAKHYIREFVHKAAESDTTPDSEYVKF